MSSASLTNTVSANNAVVRMSGMDRTVVRTKVFARAETATQGAVRTSVRFTQSIMQKAHSLFKTKVPQTVADLADCGKRTVEHWAAGNREIGMEEFFHLLEGDNGVAFLDVFWECIPAITRERWMQQEILARRLQAKEEAKAANEREIEQLRMELGSR